MTPPRPASFWAALERNVHLLEQVLKELRSDHFAAVSKQLIKALKNQEIHALEFVPHLASFCLETEKITANCARTQKESERMASVLEIQCISKKILSKLKSNSQLGLTTETDRCMYEACQRSITESCDRTSQLLNATKARLRMSESQSEAVHQIKTDDEADGRPVGRQPRPAVPQTTVASLQPKRGRDEIEAEAKRARQKQDIENLFPDHEKSPILRYYEFANDSSLEPNSSVGPSDAPKSPTPRPKSQTPLPIRFERAVPEPSDEQLMNLVLGLESPKRLPTVNHPSSKLRLLSEDTKPDVDAAMSVSAEHAATSSRATPNLGMLNLNPVQLNPSSEEILNDLWLTDEVVEPWESFSLYKKSHSLIFDLTSLELLMSRSDYREGSEVDDEKRLPIELVLLLRLPTPSFSPLGLHDRIEITVNREQVSTKPPRVNSQIWAVPIAKDLLWQGTNRLVIRIQDHQSFSRNMIGELSVQKVTLLSEAEIIEKALNRCASVIKVANLYQDLVKDYPAQLSLEDPVVHQLIEHPVRGASCKHLQCFDLQNFVRLNKGSCEWKCPMDDCQEDCLPLELEFDQWMAENIKCLKRENLKTNSKLTQVTLPQKF